MNSLLLKTLSVFLLNFVVYGQVTQDRNYALLNVLNTNSGWKKLEKTKDFISISVKKLDGAKLEAIKVEKILEIDPNLITDVIMDVENYNSFLSDAKSLKSLVVERSDIGLVGYQYIKVDFPFFDDREYFFRMNRTSFGDQDGTTMCYWVLLDPDYETNKPIESKNTTYLKQGAGIWKCESSELNKWKISYMLYMHPGGSIPDFLVDAINKRSIIGLFRDVIKEVRVRNS